MFRNKTLAREPLLPTASGVRLRQGGRGLYGAHSSKPSISSSFIATIFWVAASLGLVLSGYLYCQRRLESSSITCSHQGCEVEQYRDGLIKKKYFARHRMLGAELVRVKDGKIVDTAGMRRAAQRRLGYSYVIVVAEPDSKDDDDDSYDSYEDDDDSYDSYEDEQDSSVDDDDIEDDDDRDLNDNWAARPGSPQGPRAADKGDKGKKGPEVNNPFPRSEKATGARRKYDDESFIEKKKAQREAFARRRQEAGMPRIREPDEPRPSRFEEDERFPGDAGTMREQRRMQANMDEIRQMGGFDAWPGRPDRPYRKPDYGPRGLEREKIEEIHRRRDEAKASQNERDLNDRPPLPGDPYDREGEPPRSLYAKGAGMKRSPDDPYANHADLDQEALGGEQGGRRVLSAFGDPVEFNTEDDLVARSSEGVLNQGGGGYRRKLLSVKEENLEQLKRRGLPDSASRRRSREEIEIDAHEAREAHRHYHGHHQKKRRKINLPQQAGEGDDEAGEDTPQKAWEAKKLHHHKAFHHSEDVPPEKRRHVHHRFHHQPDQEKVPGGWKHQNRAAHKHQTGRVLGTRFNLGRVRSRTRKEAIENYVQTKRGGSVVFMDSKRWRATGLWMMIIGLISLCFSLMIGNFEPRPKARKSN